MSNHLPGCDCHPAGVSRRTVLGVAGAAAAATLAPSTSAQTTRLTVGPGKGPRIDAHVHLQALDWFSGNVFQPADPPKRRRASPAPEFQPNRAYRERRSTPPAARYGFDLEGQTAKLLADMDEGGIDTAILYAMDYDYTGKKLRVQHWEQLTALAAVRDQYPGRFILFAAIDPRRGKAGLELLRRAHRELKITGMGEFAPHLFGFPANDREHCYPVYELCAELGLHIAPNCSIVASQVSRFCDPLYFEDVAHDFPQVNLCLTSAGMPHWAESAIVLAQSKVNVYLDIGDWMARTSSDPVMNVLRFVRRALDTEARHKILFGSDYPVFNRAVSTRDWVEVFTVEAVKREMRFSDVELDLLFSDNAQNYVGFDVPMPVRA